MGRHRFDAPQQRQRCTADYTLLLAVWVLPFAAIPIGLAGLPGSFLPILALAGRLLWRIRRAEVPYAPDRTPKFPVPALQP